MPRSRQKWIALLVLLFIISGILFWVSAAQGPSPPQSSDPKNLSKAEQESLLANALAIEPSFVSSDSAIGQDNTSFKVSNTTGQSVRVQLAFYPYVKSNKIFKKSSRDLSDGPDPLIRWSSQNFLLPSQASLLVRVQPLRYPERGLDIFGEIEARASLERSTLEETRSASLLVLPTATVQAPLSIALPGTRETRFSIGKFLLQQERGGFRAWAEIKNDSNFTLRPLGSFALYDSKGDAVELTSSDGDAAVLPETSNWVSSEGLWPDLPDGDYTLRVQMSSGQSTLTRLERVSLPSLYKKLDTAEDFLDEAPVFDFSFQRVYGNWQADLLTSVQEDIAVRCALLSEQKKISEIGAVELPSSKERRIYSCLLPNAPEQEGYSIRLEAHQKSNLIYSIEQPLAGEANSLQSKPPPSLFLVISLSIFIVLLLALFILLLFYLAFENSILSRLFQSKQDNQKRSDHTAQRPYSKNLIGRDYLRQAFPYYRSRQQRKKRSRRQFGDPPYRRRRPRGIPHRRRKDFR